MSMILILAMVSPDVHQRIVETKGDYFSELLNGRTEAGFSVKRDTLSSLDYRDLVPWAEEDEDHPLHKIFNGDEWGQTLVEGFEWTNGPPMYFNPAEVKLIHAELTASDDGWPISDITEFFGRASTESKGVILGVD